jgi:hypothetical protein
LKKGGAEEKDFFSGTLWPYQGSEKDGQQGRVDMTADVVLDGRQGGLHMALDGGGGDVQCPGDLNIRELFFAAELPDLLLLGRQPVDGLCDDGAVVFAPFSFFGVSRFTGLLAPIYVAGALVGGLAEAVERIVAAEDEEPVGEAGDSRQFAAFHPDLDEDVLYNVFRPDPRVRDSENPFGERLVVGIEQPFKGGLVAEGYFVQQSLFVMDGTDQ